MKKRIITGIEALERLREIDRGRPPLETIEATHSYVEYIDCMGREVKICGGANGLTEGTWLYVINGGKTIIYFLGREHINEVNAVRGRFVKAKADGRWPTSESLSDRTLMAVVALIAGTVTGMWIAARKTP